MRRRLRPFNAIAIGAVLAVIAGGFAGCDSPHSVITAPPPPPPPPPVTGPSTGPPLPVKTIQIGDVVTGQLHASDPLCPDLYDPLDTYTTPLPCQAYRVSVPGAGVLSMHLTWDTPAGQLCVTTPWPQFVRHCRATSPVDVSANVAPGAYTFGIEFEGGAAGASPSYSLTATFSGSAAAARR